MPNWEFPGSPVIKTLLPMPGGMGLILGEGSKVPHAAWHSQNKKLNMPAIERPVS